MQVFEEIINRKNILTLKEIPSAIEMRPGMPGTARFKHGTGNVGCLGCLNPRCMFFSDFEIECKEIGGFPNDKSINVCPVEAILWDTSHSVPMIDTGKCIRCGVCVSRCPIGALYFPNQGELAVGTIQDKFVECRKADTEAQNAHLRQIDRLINVPRTGILLDASDLIFQSIYERLFHLSSNYHNIVVRNLLIALGCRCAMRRVGDVYTRMDAIYSSHGGSFGAVEIEFGKDTLDASRGILDDIAVLNARYGVDKYHNKALVICLQLPNARQGYWQVVKDINVVENIKVGTITVGALMFLVWNRCLLEPENDRYYVDYDNMDLRNILCLQVGCDNVPISNKELGIFEPMK